MRPGLALQRLTTREPSLDQVEVAVASLRAVLTAEQLAEVDAAQPHVAAAPARARARHRLSVRGLPWTWLGSWRGSSSVSRLIVGRRAEAHRGSGAGSSRPPTWTCRARLRWSCRTWRSSSACCSPCTAVQALAGGRRARRCSCAYTVVIVRRIRDGSRPPCACFGSRSKRPLGAYHVVRNLRPHRRGGHCRHLGMTSSRCVTVRPRPGGHNP